VTWYAFNGYADMSLAGSQEKQATAMGFHGYATKAQADANPNSVNILQKPLLNLLETDYAAAVKEGAQPGGPNDITTPGGAANAAAQGAGLPSFTSIQNALSGFYDVLTNGKMWRSLGWLLLGVLLMIAGVALLLKNQISRGVAGTLAGI